MNFIMKQAAQALQQGGQGGGGMGGGGMGGGAGGGRLGGLAGGLSAFTGGGGAQGPQIQLPPFNPPLGIHPNYCVPHQTTLVLREKALSFSGDDFSVQDSQGMDVIRVSGKYFAMRDKKTVTDTSGQPLFTIETKMLSLLKCQIGRSMDGREIFVCQKKFQMLGSKFEVSFTNSASNHAPITLVMSGNFRQKRARLELGGMTVATIQENWMNIRNIFGNDQTYTVTCAPGVDLALVAAICICFDEAEHDKD